MFLNGNVLEFDDVYELNYELLNEMELELRPDGTIYMPSKNALLHFNGMVIKASTRPDQIHYAGQGEIMMDVLNNVRMITTFLGVELNRKQEEGMSFLSFFPDEKVVEEGDNEVKYTNITVKQSTTCSISSPYYKNKCLAYIWTIFALNDDFVDLSRFDIIEERK